MPSLNVPQAAFLAMPHKFRAYVAGFGSGKTWVGCGGLMQHFWEYPRINAGYFAPTYPQIRDIFYPTVEEVARDWGLRCDIVESNKEVHIYEGRRYRGTVICRSMEKPETIIGFKIGKALCDELDVMKAPKARLASALSNQQEQNDRRLGAFGMGSRALEQANDSAAIVKEYQRYQDQLAKATPKDLIGSDAYRADVQKIQDGLNASLAEHDRYYSELAEKQANWKNGASQAIADYVESGRNMSSQMATSPARGLAPATASRPGSRTAST